MLRLQRLQLIDSEQVEVGPLVRVRVVAPAQQEQVVGQVSVNLGDVRITARASIARRNVVRDLTQQDRAQ